MKSVLITGGTGAFGQAFTERLLKDGLASRICLLARNEYNMFQVRERFNGRIRPFIGDVRDRDRLRRAMKGCDTVVHAAALKRVETGEYNPIEMCKTNIDGAINVVESSQDTQVSRVVALSTDKAFQPISPYGQSKALAESIFLSANNTVGLRRPRFSVCRYGNVWRSTGSVVPTWEQQLKDGDTIGITNPECTRFFMRMSEAVDLVLSTIADMPAEVAIPTLPAYRLGDLADAMGIKERWVTGLPKWEKLHESMDQHRCSKDARRMTVDELRAEL